MLLASFVVGQFEEIEFEASAEGNEQIRLAGALVNECLDLGKPLVLLLDVITRTAVNEENNGLGSKKLELIQEINIDKIPVSKTHILLLFLQELENLFDTFQFLAFGLVVLGRLNESLLTSLKELNILELKFFVDDFHITNGVDVTLNVSDFGIIENTQHVENAVNCLNVRQESITKTLAFMSTLDKTSNIGNIQHSRYLAGRLPEVDEKIETLIRHSNLASIRINRTEREVFCRNRALSQNVEESTLADVGKTNNTNLKIGSKATHEELLGLGFSIVLLWRHFCVFSA